METDKITSSYRKSIGANQIVVDVVLQKEDEGSISKVLSANATSFVDDIEVLNGEAHYVGATVFDVLYLDEKGQTHTLQGKAELGGKIENETLNPLMKPIYKVETIETKIESMEDDRVKVSATVEINLDVFETDEVDEAKFTGQNLEFNTEPIKNYSVVSSGTKTFQINENYDTKVDVQKILFSLAHTNLKNVESGSGYFTLTGDLFVNSLLEVQTDEGKTIKNFMETIPFKEELEDELVAKDDFVYAYAFVKPQDLAVTVSGDTEQSQKSDENATSVAMEHSLNISATVTVKYIALRSVETNIVVDAFSMTNKTNIVTDSFVASGDIKTDNYSTSIEGQVIIEDTEPRIAKISAVTDEHISVASSKMNDGELTIEGVANMTVLYLTDDDVPTQNSIDLEIPFSNKFDVQNLPKNLFVRPSILDIEVKARKGKEINVSVDVNFVVESFDTITQAVIKDIELIEELLPNDYSLEIYIAPKGSSLWDISKHLLVTKKVLMEQNPDLVFPLESSQSVVYFKKRS